MVEVRHIIYFLVFVTCAGICLSRDPRYIDCYAHFVTADGTDLRHWTFPVLRSVPGGDISVNLCLVECRVRNFTYAGLVGASSQSIQCLCGDTRHDDYDEVYAESDRLCSVECPLDPGDTCGKYRNPFTSFISLYFADCLDGWEGIVCNISTATTFQPTTEYKTEEKTKQVIKTTTTPEAAHHTVQEMASTPSMRALSEDKSSDPRVTIIGMAIPFGTISILFIMLIVYILRKQHKNRQHKNMGEEIQISTVQSSVHIATIQNDVTMVTVNDAYETLAPPRSSWKDEVSGHQKDMVEPRLEKNEGLPLVEYYNPSRDSHTFFYMATPELS